MFRKIGDYELAAEGNLVVMRSSAVWNTEATVEYAATIAQMVQLMPPRWGVLAIVAGVPIWSPEGERVMCDSARMRHARGMRALALIVTHEEGEAISRRQFARIYGSAGISLQYFDDEAAARAWLASVIDAEETVG